MSIIPLLLNLLWIVFGGLWMALAWVIAAVVMAITIVGLPWARAAFSIAARARLLWQVFPTNVLQRGPHKEPRARHSRDRIGSEIRARPRGRAIPVPSRENLAARASVLAYSERIEGRADRRIPVDNLQAA
jgi:Inner membrane component domain